MGRGLLSRIDARARSAIRSTEDIGEVIASHLRVLLNARRGDAATLPTFGLSDFNSLVHALPEAIQALQSSIRSTILEFEPRLKNVSVRYLPDHEPLLLKFEIIAQLAEKDARGFLRFQTQLSPGGRFDLV
jgi:type VI secretion system protein